MITTISKEEAITELRNDDNASWSYEAAAAIYDYLEALEDDCGIVTVFNIIDIRCEFSEYANLEAWNESYHGPEQGIPERWTLEELQERTTVLEFEYMYPNEYKPNGLVVAQFGS
jgi:hypothetical protein